MGVMIFYLTNEQLDLIFWATQSYFIENDYIWAEMEIGQTGLGIDYDLDSIPEVYFARRVGN